MPFRNLDDNDTLRLLVRNLPVGVYVTTESGELLDANPGLWRCSASARWRSCAASRSRGSSSAAASPASASANCSTRPAPSASTSCGCAVPTAPCAR